MVSRGWKVHFAHYFPPKLGQYEFIPFLRESKRKHFRAEFEFSLLILFFASLTFCPLTLSTCRAREALYTLTYISFIGMRIPQKKVSWVWHHTASDGESTHSLPLIPGQFWLELVEPVRMSHLCANLIGFKIIRI